MKILKLSFAAIILIAVAFPLGASTLVKQSAIPGDCIPKFTVPLPVFGPAGTTPRVNTFAHPNITVKMKEVDQAVLPQGVRDTCKGKVVFGPTRVWAYEISDSKTNEILGAARWPAVTVEATRFAQTTVTYKNELPAFNPSNSSLRSGPFLFGLVQGLLTIDQTLHWADPLGLMCTSPLQVGCSQPFVGAPPAVVHLHGAEVLSGFDGNPTAWFTADGKTGPGFVTQGAPKPGEAVFVYNNTQEPGTLWFHDHALGATRTNVYSGLEAFYFVRDAANEPKNLPSGAQEMELVFQDRQFDTNSQLFFPDGSGKDAATSNLNGTPTNPDVHPFWIPEFIGDVSMVNGAPWPFLNVEPRRYRFRLLDGSNARMYRMQFGGAKVYQIGADDNYLDKPVPVSEVFLAPAERADVIIDFSQLAGKTVFVTNDAPVPFPSGLVPQIDQPGMVNIMQFRVSSKKVSDPTCNPVGDCRRPVPIPRLANNGRIDPAVKVDKVRRLALKEHEGPGGPLEVLLNNTHFDGLAPDGLIAPNLLAFGDGPSEKPVIGSTELWEILNLTMDAHPIHTHLVQFQILNRQSIDVDGTMGSPGGGFGYVGFDDGINPPIPGVWALAFANIEATKPCELADPLNPCPAFGPPLLYDKGDTITLPNGQIVPLVGGNPDVTPFLLNDAAAPAANEAGWKDTVKTMPGQVTRILVRWAPTTTRTGTTIPGVNLYPFDPTQGPGYMWHCHILDHEDNDMMRPYVVVK